MKKRTVLLAGLAAAMMMAVPALAEDAVITEPLDFVYDVYSNPSSNYYTWDASTQTLTLKDGFKMDVSEIDNDGIIVAPGTTIVVEGDADISADDCIYVPDKEENFDETVTVQLKNGADLTLTAYDNGIDIDIDTYCSLAIIGDNRDSCTLTVNAPEDEGIWVDYDITIKNVTLSVYTEDEEGIYSSMGFITIDNSKIKIVCEEECIDAAAGITITNTSLDLTSTDGDGVLDVDSDSDLGITLEYAYANNIHLDSQFVLYGENGKRLTNTPIAYSADLITIEYYDDESYNEYWAYNGTPVYRLVTAADTSIYIEKTLGSLKTVSFSGDGAEALDGLVRAFGSTINLTKIVPAAREGYTFTGWYADPACTKPITKLVVTGNMEIYAGWELIPVEEEETAETAVEAAAE